MCNLSESLSECWDWLVTGGQTVQDLYSSVCTSTSTSSSPKYQSVPSCPASHHHRTQQPPGLEEIRMSVRVQSQLLRRLLSGKYYCSVRTWLDLDKSRPASQTLQICVSCSSTWNWNQTLGRLSDITLSITRCEEWGDCPCLKCNTEHESETHTGLSIPQLVIARPSLIVRLYFYFLQQSHLMSGIIVSFCVLPDTQEGHARHDNNSNTFLTEIIPPHLISPAQADSKLALTEYWSMRTR